MTTLKSSLSGSITLKNSTIEPGQPWVMTSGIASGSSERTWTKWRPSPSISIRHWGSALRRASVARQSYPAAQCSHSSLRYASGTPATSRPPSPARASASRADDTAGHRAPRQGPRCGTSPRVSVELQLAQRRPAGVGLALVGVLRRAVQVRAAHGAEPGAILAADDLRWERQGERVAGPAAHVEVALVEVGRAQLVAAAGLVDLAGVHLHRVARRLEAAHARAVELRAEAEAEGVPAHRVRHVEPRVHLAALDVVALPAEVEPVDRHLETDCSPLPGGEPEPTHVEDVRALRHDIEASARRRVQRRTPSRFVAAV